ncbi:flagellar biosynthesis protein FlhF [Saccharibacillus sp. CPCC 101409]|uniref:flagellar biosynthesis protein FlhF n=1 Tax=Saccharibacillus sp. CPCC 101409 TaxID=3058041 RepID=UPI002673DDB1|nr:flagellar biosynthesis protein FlhF [Saccharibacillus sp. CPCC 101409]MDO3410683.1 flagellar biosynthesis protein FlhF [Saccharibacillus sp. CPCC 101409]
MIVKRYVVETMIEAMQKIRTDLGSDAVILSTKETKVGGLFGMFGKKKLEVVAALETEKKEKEQVRVPAAQAAASGPVPAAVIPRSAGAGAYRRASAASNPQQTESAPTASGTPVEAKSGTERKSVPGLETPSVKPEAQSSDNSSNGSVRPPLARQPEPAAEETDYSSQSEQQRRLERSIREHQQAAGPQAREERLYEELRQMRLMIDKLSRQSDEVEPLPEELDRLLGRLRKQQLDEELIEEWLRTIRSPEGGPFSPNCAEELRNEIVRFALEREGGGIDPQTRVVYVAGPTGVGKTTTIAKLAAEQMFKHKRKVGLITADTYRISAVEQLRTYASILNVPLEVVQSPGDLQRAFNKLESCDLILMDTAGRNYRNELLVSELQTLISPVESSETYLVLSLTSKLTDMAEITENFNHYRLDKIIFTKADETGSFGSIFSLLYRYPLKYSYITNGQNVPDDLLLPGGNLLVDVLLGERKL